MVTRNSLLLTALLALNSCTCGENKQSPVEQRIPLKVALFPFLPDAYDDHFAALRKRIKEEFEKEENVELTILDFDTKVDLYSTAGLKQLFEVQQCDIVELDAVMLGSAVKDGLIQPWDVATKVADWHPAAQQAITLKGTPYGQPHWMCGFFLFSRSSAIADAVSLSALSAALRGDPSSLPDIAGNLLSGWDATGLYLDSWIDDNGAQTIAQPLSSTVSETDAPILHLREIAKLCQRGNDCPCTGGMYKGNTLAATEFGQHKVDTMFGYSQRLHYILREKGADAGSIRVTSLPLGAARTSGLFTDLLVLNKKCDEKKQRVAAAFAAYLVRPEVYAWMLASRDDPASPREPRYLLPARLAPYSTGELKSDPFYVMLQSATKGAVSFPNTVEMYEWKSKQAGTIQSLVSKN